VEYTLPIRVRWDVDFRGSAGRTKRIARRIRDASPLFVELRIEGERGLSDLAAIVAEMQAVNPRMAVTMGLFTGAALAVRWAYPVDLIWDAGRDAFFRLRLPEGAGAVSFILDEDTVSLLPDVLREFGECAARELHLPNVNAVRSLASLGHVPIPRQEQIRAAVEAVGRERPDLSGRRIVVHDFFLWKALRGAFPETTGARTEFSGCQAGSALAYVDWDGNVYPCDALPIRLGNLEESPFERIWGSSARENLLTSIRSIPPSCGGCDEFDGCLSGCRGLSYMNSGAFDRPDPGCSRPEESGE
jgi:GeoRSP system SPASM domain protein